MPSGDDDLSVRGVPSGSFGVASRAADDVLDRASALLHMFRENAILMADPESLSGVIYRGTKTFDEHQRRLRKSAGDRTRLAGGDTLVWLGILSTAMEPYEDPLREKYGDDFTAKIAAKYLDEKTIDELSKIENIEQRQAMMREELYRKHAAGDIEILEDEVRDWLDSYGQERGAYLDEINALRAGVLEEKDASLRSTFSANAPLYTAQHIVVAECPSYLFIQALLT